LLLSLVLPVDVVVPSEVVVVPLDESAVVSPEVVVVPLDVVVPSEVVVVPLDVASVPPEVVVVPPDVVVPSEELVPPPEVDVLVESVLAVSVLVEVLVELLDFSFFAFFVQPEPSSFMGISLQVSPGGQTSE